MAGENTCAPGVSADAELIMALQQNFDILGEQGLHNLIEAHRRFDRPVRTLNIDGGIKTDPYFFLKGILEQIPDYMQAALEAGVVSHEAQALLIHTLEASAYEFLDNKWSIHLLARVLRVTGSRGESLSPDDLEKLKGLISLGGKYGVIPDTFEAYEAARRVGLSFDETIALVAHLPIADGQLSKYSFTPFTEALQTLIGADVDAHLVTKVFSILGGKRPYYQQSAYRAFEEFLTFIAPAYEIAPAELMHALATRVKRAEDVEDFLIRYVDHVKRRITGNHKPEVLSAGEKIPKRFRVKSGMLEHRSLSYQIKRGFHEGLHDLERMALARLIGFREPVAEGFWAFDPETSTWYSFGGKTTVESDHVRHMYVPFDISELSKHPVLVHIHPKDFEIMTLPDFSKPPLGLVREEIASFLSATPSREDYKTVASMMRDATTPVHPRSFIVSAWGITEFCYPNDNEAIEDYALISRDLRDQVFMSFPWDQVVSYMERTGVTADRRVLIRQLIDIFNMKLPEGFRLIFHPTGETFG